jgi:hypothetical protein
MDLPDTPIANERFFATHFFTLKDPCSDSWREGDQGGSLLYQAG